MGVAFVYKNKVAFVRSLTIFRMHSSTCFVARNRRIGCNVGGEIHFKKIM